MSAPVLRVGVPLWVVRGPASQAAQQGPQGAKRGVLMRSVAPDQGGPGDPTAVVLGWSGAEPQESGSGEVVRTVITQVRSASAPRERDGELTLDADAIVLVTVFEVGQQGADGLLADLDEATDSFLARFTAVEGVAFARSDDGRWVVEVLRAASVEAMSAVQGDPQMNAHIEHMGRSAASMQPALNHVEKVLGADGR